MPEVHFQDLRNFQFVVLVLSSHLLAKTLQLNGEPHWQRAIRKFNGAILDWQYVQNVPKT